MTRIFSLSLLGAFLAVSGCQQGPVTQDGPKQRAGAPICNRNLANAGYCYGITLPAQPGT